MDVTVIGAGPAGLYFASMLKQIDPSHTVKIIEKNKKEDVNGLGYVLQRPIFEQIASLDESLVGDVVSRATNVFNYVELEAKMVVIGKVFPNSVGIRRAALLDSLRSYAEKKGVEIVYNSVLSSEHIERYRNMSDVVVGADGINSVVRKAYSSGFGASEIRGENVYIWLMKKDKEGLMKVNVQQNGADVNSGRCVTLIGTSYPIDACSNVMVIEANAQRLRKSGTLGDCLTAGMISPKSVRELEWIFSSFTTDTRLESVDSRWSATVVNRCERLAFENLALLGEAGMSTHYSIGAGLLAAFKGAGELARCLASKNEVDNNLSKYNTAMLPWLISASDLSLQSMQWLERVDSHYNTAFNGTEFLRAFAHKSK